jgi:dTDP-4-dehydrorhamnose reductase
MSLELWGGLECTVNRVGDVYFDQIVRTGHHARPQDLELIASLGVNKLRYPILWERTELAGSLDWAWSDARLARLRDLNIAPIVGLLHHGSGPAHTSLTDPKFPEKFCAYARAAAERYPWIENYTPVNEPLTTARFSGLYGHWYPHGKSDKTFVRALLHQCRATILAMRAIREVNPAARLIQTEDLGKTFSTPRMAYQARFDNERRWLTFDLLCGLVDDRHPLTNYFCDSGIAQPELEWFLENPCPPDILGVNHYLTSDRYLDERINLYPAATHGTNTRHRYADVEAVRVDLADDLGPAARLAEISSRYRLPVAVTEVHLGGPPDEQVNWFREVWNAAELQRANGYDVRAVTAWALLGSFDWNSLLVRNDNVYEPGVFDLRDGEPQPAALANILKEIANGHPPNHSPADGPGWWRKPERIQYAGSQFTTEFLEQTAEAAVHTSA